jgi:hypothetical protein
MTRQEFGIVMAFLAKGTGAKNIDAGQAEVYFDLLADLPLPLVQEPGPEAWRLAIGAAERYGEANESRGLATLPADVAAAVRAFGWRVLCDARRDELGIVQTQFLKVYATLEMRSDRRELMPPMSEKCAAICGTIGLPALEEK